MAETERFLRAFNSAFETNDKALIANSVAGDVIWTIVGDKVLHGREAVEQEFASMDGGGLVGMEISRIILEGDAAAVHGTVSMSDEGGAVRQYEYCDLYVLERAEGIKIKELTSLIMDITK